MERRAGKVETSKGRSWKVNSSMLKHCREHRGTKHQIVVESLKVKYKILEGSTNHVSKLKKDLLSKINEES